MKDSPQLNGKWEWAKLTPYLKPEDSNGSDEAIQVLINTSSFKEEYKLKFETNTENSNSQSKSKFIGIEPQEVEIIILLDATGIFDRGFGQSMMKSIQSFSPKKQTKSVNEQINKLRDTFLQIDPSTHEPQTLGFSWGKFNYKCTVQSLTVDYKLFGRNGDALRAELTLKTIKKSDPVLPNSPDLTHIRTFKSSDNWQLLTHEIYRDTKYYWQVAKANRLIHFRKIAPGKKLFFPPISK